MCTFRNLSPVICVGIECLFKLHYLLRLVAGVVSEISEMYMKSQYNSGYESGTQYFIENLPLLMQTGTTVITMTEDQLLSVKHLVKTSKNIRYYKGFMEGLLHSINVFNEFMSQQMDSPIDSSPNREE